MPGPIAPFADFAQASAAGAPMIPDVDGSLYEQQFRMVIKLSDAVGVVHWNGDQSRYEINPAQLATLPEGYWPIISAAVARAGTDPLVSPGKQEEAAKAAGSAEIGKIIEDIGKVIPYATKIPKELETIIKGAKPT